MWAASVCRQTGTVGLNFLDTSVRKIGVFGEKTRQGKLNGFQEFHVTVCTNSKELINGVKNIMFSGKKCRKQGIPLGSV